MIYTIQKYKKPTLSTKWLVTETQALVTRKYGFLTINKALAFIEEKLKALA